jgi:hypothetical protein
MTDVLGSCGVHPDAGAALACARCGAFACAVCAPSPSLLCEACRRRRPARHRGVWHELPPAPGLLRRWATSIPVFYGAFALLAIGARVASSARALIGIAISAMVVVLLGLARLLVTVIARRGRAVLAIGLRSMRMQASREAAVVFEEALRFERLDPATRALSLWLFGASASAIGEHERALTVLEPITASAWRATGPLRLLRGPGQIVLAVTRALAGDQEGAARARAAYRPSILHRFTYSPSYGDALIALRRGERGETIARDLAASIKHARRMRDGALERAASLLDGFHRERIGEDPSAIEEALLQARLSPLEAHRGLSRHWPELAEFVERRFASR